MIICRRQWATFFYSGRISCERRLQGLDCGAETPGAAVVQNGQGIENPNLYAYDVPSAYSFGSREEAVLIFRNSCYSWLETEPAIRYIRGVINDDR
jgi:hypothetical protein